MIGSRILVSVLFQAVISLALSKGVRLAIYTQLFSTKIFFFKFSMMWPLIWAALTKTVLVVAAGILRNNYSMQVLIVITLFLDWKDFL